MKANLASHLCGALMILCTLAPADTLSAAVYLDEDFTTVTSGWGSGTATAYGSISFAEGGSSPAAFPTRSLMVSHLPADTTALLSTSPGFTGGPISRTSNEEINLSFSLRLSTNNVIGAIYFGADNSAQRPLSINLTGGGAITAYHWNGSANAYATLLSTYQANTTYHFDIAFTPSSNTYSVTISGGGTASASDLSFARTNAGQDVFTTFTNVQILNYGAGGLSTDPHRTIYIDDVSVQSIPEPGTLGLLSLAGLALFLHRRNRHSASSPCA